MQKIALVICCWVFLSGDVWGHSDPRGDVHPVVLVESGNFAVYFYTNALGDRYFEGEQPTFRMLYTPEGRLLAPRHAVKLRREKNLKIYVERFRNEKPNATIFLPEGKKQTLALAWPKDTRVHLVESSSISSDHIALAVKLMYDREDRTPDLFDLGLRGQFFVYLFPREGFGKPEQFLIGIPKMIYDFPIASNLVFANGKFWVAWVRASEREGKPFEMVLSSIEPGSGNVIERILDTPADWNSHLSLAVIGGRLCLAYHCVVDHEYPGISEIITVFTKAE